MPILTETFEGVPGGMNLALAPQELDDTEARYLQDILLDQPGFTRRRGPVRQVPNTAGLGYRGTGLALALNPAGKARFAMLNGDNSNGYFSAYSDDLTTKVDLTWPHPLPTNPAVAGQEYRIVDAKPALNGGTWVGVSSTYDSNSPNQGLALWMGANKPNWSTTVSATQGSATITGSGFTANVVPGMFLFATISGASALVGVVKTVNSDTSLTLRDVSVYALASNAATFQALRGFAPKVVTGQITADTGSNQVTGGGTKFLSQKLNVGAWNLYRASDMAHIGTVSSVQSEIALTLTGNANISVSSVRYVAQRRDSDWSIPTTANTNKVGFLTATYAGRQWYANNGAQLEKTSRVWFSDTGDPEAVDMADFDGDWDTISNTSSVDEPIRAIAPANSGLVVFKENETFIITGNSPNSFAPKKLEDDGAASGMSVQQYGGGVIWAGREGIHYFDGIQTHNLTNAKLGDYWKSTIRTFDPTKFRMWSMLNRDHYFLFIEDVDPPVPVIKGTISTTPNKLTVVINMNTRAVTMFTNLDIRGSVTLPSEAGKNSWFLINSASRAYIADAEALFTEEGADTINADGEIAPALTVSGNEITDATRAVGTAGDGLSADSSYGLWSNSTNLITNGGFETNTTGWTSGLYMVNVSTHARVNTEKKFGSWSLKVTTDGVEALEGAESSSGIAAISGQTYTASMWVKAPVGKALRLELYNSGAGGISFQQFTGTGAWQRVTTTGVATTTSLGVAIRLDFAAQGVFDFYIDGVQLEERPFATPYIHTDGGIVTRSAGRVEAPKSALNQSQGWVAMRVRHGMGAGTEEMPGLFGWGDWFQGFRILYGSGQVVFQRAAGPTTSPWNGVGQGMTAALGAGTLMTVVAAWTDTQIKISVNGAAFAVNTGAANTTPPDPMPSTFRIGEQAVGGQMLNGDVLWFAAGKGTLTDADAAALHAKGNTDPTFSDFTLENDPTLIWNANTATAAATPVGPDFYFESKKYDAGDSTRLKKFKQLMIHYLIQGGAIKVDTVVGLNNLGKTLTGTFPQSVFSWGSLGASIPTWDALKAQYATWSQLVQGVFKPKRLKFQKSSQHLNFRLYQSNKGVSRLRVGPFHIGYKQKRPGRI